MDDNEVRLVVRRSLPLPRRSGSLAVLSHPLRHGCFRLKAATSSARSGWPVLVRTDHAVSVADSSQQELQTHAQAADVSRVDRAQRPLDHDSIAVALHPGDPAHAGEL